MAQSKMSKYVKLLELLTLQVWDTTLAMLDMLATPTLMEPESPPPTLPLDTLWPTLPVESPTPPTLVSAPTTSEPSFPARQSVSSTVSTSSSVKFIEILIKTKILQILSLSSHNKFTKTNIVT